MSTAPLRLASPVLSRSVLPHLGRGVSVPSYDAAELAPGIVHLGLGSFARAHVCAYLDRLAEERVTSDWGVIGSGLRTASIADALSTQDHLWTNLPGGLEAARVVGVLRDYIDGVRDRGKLLEAMSSPSTRVVSLTVTAPAYDRPGVAFDLVAEALQRRRAAGLGPFTVLSCDNLPDNGALARTAVLNAAEVQAPGLAPWIDQHVTFPRSMVDRIALCASDQQRGELQWRLGFDDALAVSTETFSQWVVTDEFCAGRPPLEEAGVQVVADATPHVEAKTRLLNGSHVALGFLGARAGHATAAVAMSDPSLRRFVRRMMRDEVAPGLTSAPGLDLASYQAAIHRRLRDEHVQDPVARLCRRGSVRVQNYVLPSLRSALEDDRPRGRLVQVLAAWVSHLASAGEQGDLAGLEDPRAEWLAPLAVRALHDPAPLLAVTEVFGELGRDPRLVGELRRALVTLQREEWRAPAC